MNSKQSPVAVKTESSNPILIERINDLEHQVHRLVEIESRLKSFYSRLTFADLKEESEDDNDVPVRPIEERLNDSSSFIDRFVSGMHDIINDLDQYI